VKSRPILAAVIAAALALAGCGGGNDKPAGSSASTAPPRTQASTPAAAPAGGTPTYEEVKKLALADPKLKPVCAKGQKDLDIEGSAPGEQFKRFICGNTEVFDYSDGEKNFARDYAAVKNEAQQPLWVLDKQAFVMVPTIIASPGFAAKIKQQCGCGQVVDAG
jgi:hypothetical protein